MSCIKSTDVNTAVLSSLPVRWLLLRASQTWPCRWWHHHPRTTSWLWLVRAWRCSSWWGCSAADSPNASRRSWRTGRPRPLRGQDTPTEETTTAEKRTTPPHLPALRHRHPTSTLFASSLEWHYPQSCRRQWAWSVTHLLFLYTSPSHSPGGHAPCRRFFFFSSWASIQSPGSSCSFTPLSPDVDAVLLHFFFFPPPPFAVGWEEGGGGVGVVRIWGQRSRYGGEGG